MIVDNTTKFTGKSSAYVEARPGYVSELFDYLKDELGVNEQTIIADIGSGTGKLSQDLLKIAGTVYCVEPNDEMRQVAESLLHDQEGFISVKGSAEQTTLVDKCVDFILVGQAFHWFEPKSFKKECTRLLKDKGKVILVWNSRVKESEQIIENDEICKQYCKTFKGFSGGLEEQMISDFFDGVYKIKKVKNDLLFDKEKYMKRMMSASYSLTENDPNFTDYFIALEQFFDKYAENGILTMPNETVWYIGEV